ELRKIHHPSAGLQAVVHWFLCPTGECLTREPSEVEAAWNAIRISQINQDLRSSHRVLSEHDSLLGRLKVVPHYQHTPPSIYSTDPEAGPSQALVGGVGDSRHIDPISPCQKVLEQAAEGKSAPLLVAGGFLHKEGLRPHDIWTLGAHNKYINDEIVNTFRQLAMHEAKKAEIQVISSFFFTKVLKGDAPALDRLNRWFRSGLDVQQLIVPVHSVDPLHWSIGVVNFGGQRFEYFDSVAAGVKNRGKRFRTEMVRFWKQFPLQFPPPVQTDGQEPIKPKPIDTWSLHYPRVPKQKDSVSCGVYALYFIEELAHGRTPTTSAMQTQDDVRDYRSGVLERLARLGIMPPLESEDDLARRVVAESDSEEGIEGVRIAAEMPGLKRTHSATVSEKQRPVEPVAEELPPRKRTRSAASAGKEKPADEPARK
ncbi:Smt3-specific protease, partial [Tulasnella sp. 403]